MKNDWFIISLLWTGTYLLPPFLFLIGFGLISEMAFNSETKLVFWIWVLVTYVFLFFCLILYKVWLNFMIKKTREIIG